MSDHEAIKAICGLRYRGDTDELLRIIANELRKENPDPYALKLVAMAIDPDKRGTFGINFVVQRTGPGAPIARPDDRGGFLMWALVDVLSHKFEQATAIAREVFGLSRTKASEALAAYRESVKDDPELMEWHAKRVRYWEGKGELARLWQSD